MTRPDHPRRRITIAGLLPLLGVREAHATDAALLRELRAGGALLMRHTQTTPGVGDPPGWSLGKCASQRNLDDTGIAHAGRIGRWFADHRLRPSAVRNSPWCRCRDTAHLAFGRSDDWQPLSNIFEDRSGADAQALAVRRLVETLQPGELVLLVSHGSTIAHIAGSAAAGLAPGEAVLARRGPRSGARLRVNGRLSVP